MSPARGRIDNMPPPSGSRRVAVGRWLDRVGQLALPAGVGVIAGYWIADLGAPWMPNVLAGVAVFFVYALLMILLGQWLKGKVVRAEEGRSTVRRRAVVLLSLAVIAVGVRLAVHWMEQPAPLTRLERGQLLDGLRLDGARLADIDRELEHLVGRVEASGLVAWGEARPLSAAEEALLRDVWAAFYHSAFALDQIRVFYEDWYRFDPSRAERPLLLRSYLLTFAAELTLYEKALRLVGLLVERDEVKTFLDAPHPEQGLPANTLSVFRQEFLGARDEARVIAGGHYLRFLDEALAARALAAELGVEELWRDIERHQRAIAASGLFDRAEHTLRADLQVLKRAVRRTWFPTQTAVANWMGDVKTRRVGRYLISEEQMDELDRRLEPGDILVSRKNWYLSNVGLPGFWPHAILYIGGPDKLRGAFATDEVRAWLGESLEDHLARRFPIAWGRYLAGLDGHEIVVIEAVGEGVVLNSLAHALGDYVGAVRPRLSTLARAQAVVAAFSHLDKPYDFDFDFATDHALVCTELVWRSYRPAEGKDGLELPVRTVAGRLTLPANDIVALYAAERGSEDRSLDFVAFLDAREREARAVVADEAAFSATHLRSKWDLAQE